jgi:hypothetical protein
LAWRVKKILDALILAQSAAETNFRSLAAFLDHQIQDLKIVGGLDEQVERSHRFSILLLVVGFMLIAAGAFISAYAVWAG